MAVRRTKVKTEGDQAAEAGMVGAEVVAVTERVVAKPAHKKSVFESAVEKVSSAETDIGAAFSEITRAIEESRVHVAIEQERLEKEVGEKKEQWRREQEQYTYEQNLIRTREREEFERRKQFDLEEWNRSRKAREEDLNIREAATLENEAHLKDLERQVAAFTTTLEKTKTDAIKETDAKVRAEAKVIAELKQKDVEREAAIAKIKHDSLEAELARARAYAGQIEKQLEMAVDKAQKLAVTVVEGVAKTRERVSETQLTGAKDAQ
ncbi:hypothetical protein HY413_00030 [Candidatus Kaiserbacteria bacterium]|nr:hypothetical protein [Candidatus Kaiserbacteria bacterium]